VYIIAFTYQLPWVLHGAILGVCLVIFTACGVIFAVLLMRSQFFRPNIKIMMTVLGEIYLAVMCTMVLTAFNWETATLSSHPSPLMRTPWVGIGALLYFFSDVLLVSSGIADLNYQKIILGIFVSLTYYFSQTSIAFGMAFKYLSYQ